MRVDEISNFEALVGLLVIVLGAVLFYLLVPRAAGGEMARRFGQEEIIAHDRALRKYPLAAALALTVGGLHLAVKSMPPFAAWLEAGGRGGHLFADIAYSHMVIVLGGTIAVTGLTWYALPRILRRPLYSATLAHLAFWGTVLGAAGFYLTNVVAGLVMASLVHGGLSEAAANDAVGLWRSFPTAIFATVMGLGYWIFVINVFVTCLQGREVAEPQPLRYLAKFFWLGAAGLMIGTIQGVFQVVPDNEDWLKAAGAAGRYIDPVAHAHVNLVTGMMMLLAGLVFLVVDDGGARWRRSANLVFWLLGAGSLALYASFLMLGVVEGELIVEGGLDFAGAVARLGPLHLAALAGSGLLVLAGSWLFLARAWQGMRRVLVGRIGARLVLLGVAVLVVGTLQGALQLLPGVKQWLVASEVAGEAVPRAHAQLNMLGGVMPILLGLTMLAHPGMLGRRPEARLERRMVWMLGTGAGLYYLATMARALAGGDAASAHGAPLTGALAILAGLLYAAGAAWFLALVWGASRDYRRQGWRDLRHELARHDAPRAPWRGAVPPGAYLGPEAVGALFGFPGLGWILAGKALLGVPLMFAGPAVAWAVIPLLLSPYLDLGIAGPGVLLLQGYLVGSAVLSTATLWISLRRTRAARA